MSHESSTSNLDLETLDLDENISSVPINFLMVFPASTPIKLFIERAISQRKLYAKVCQFILPVVPVMVPDLTPEDVGVLRDLAKELQKEFRPR